MLRGNFLISEKRWKSRFSLKRILGMLGVEDHENRLEQMSPRKSFHLLSNTVEVLLLKNRNFQTSRFSFLIFKMISSKLGERMQGLHKIERSNVT